MPRYCFHFRARGKLHRDQDGTDLPDVAAARKHASAVAHELTRNAGAATRHWSIYVEDEAGVGQFELFFADVDPSLASCPTERRRLARETCRRIGALTDVLTAAHATRVESVMLLARSRRKPQLVYARGE